MSLLLSSLLASANPEILWLKVGEVRSLSASPSATIRIGKRNIIRVAEAGAQIRVIGLKPGETALAVEDKSFLVRVSEGPIKDFQKALAAALKPFKGLRLSFQNGEATISGTLLRFSDWQDLAGVAADHGARFSFTARALSDVAEEALRYFQALAKKRGIPLLRFSADPRFTVHLPAGDDDLKDSVSEIFEPYGMAVKTVRGELSLKPLVRTEVILAEVSRSHGRVFGIEWPSGVEGQILPKLSVTQSLMATLKALESEGHAQILASPNLLCRSGGEARFHAGGEFPIRVFSRLNKDVLWKKHGVLLNVKPKADFSGALSLEIETEVSILDHAAAVDGIPALKTNRVHSHFDLPGRRTIALSGLLRQEVGRNREGLPIFGAIPILGPLFSSRQFQARESELVIFVTPELHTPEADASLEMPKGWVRHDW